ncbi:sensor histidine kinase [Streptoverticillium reticulum]|uniref:sensor histidine kinase n=1 Tax=Streptoverticillium reticulum TaxID=1433415 RepID=UPI0039BFB8CB
MIRFSPVDMQRFRAWLGSPLWKLPASRGDALVAVALAGHGVSVVLVRAAPHSGPVTSVILNIAGALAFPLLRRSSPVLYATFACTIYIITDLYALLMAAAYALGDGFRVRPRRRAVAQVGLTLMAMLTGGYRSSGNTVLKAGIGYFGSTAQLPGWVFRLSVPVVSAFMLGLSHYLLAELRERNWEIERQHGARIEEARRRERTAIARDMHDELGHSLSLISLYAGALENQARYSGEVRKLGMVINKASIAAHDNLRVILRMLRDTPSPMQAEPEHASSGAAMAELVANAATTGLDLRMEHGWDCVDPLPPEAKAALYRTLQESLTNIIKYAAGSQVRVDCARTEDGVRLIVRNTMGQRGPSGDQSAGFGLVGMEERAVSLGGSLRAGPTNDGGFEVDLFIPIPTALEASV